MNKTVLVTGGAKGIGRKIAEDFASLGYNVCINYNTYVVELGRFWDISHIRISYGSTNSLLARQ